MVLWWNTKCWNNYGWKSWFLKVLQEYNGTSWSEGTSIPVNFGGHGSGGSGGMVWCFT